MVSLDTLSDVPLLPTLPLGPPIPLAVSRVPTASSLRSLRPHPHRASRVPGSSGVTHTMAHITPSRILQKSFKRRLALFMYSNYSTTRRRPAASSLIVTKLRSSGTARINTVFMWDYGRTVPFTAVLTPVPYRQRCWFTVYGTGRG